MINDPAIFIIFMQAYRKTQQYRFIVKLYSLILQITKLLIMSKSHRIISILQCYKIDKKNSLRGKLYIQKKYFQFKFKLNKLIKYLQPLINSTIMPKTIIFLSCILILTFCISPQPQTQTSRKLKFENLQTANYTGSAITLPMVTFFIKTINEAYKFYLEDLQNNTLYIQNRLEGSYSSQFDVIILRENITTAFYLYSITGASNVAWTLVNSAQPNWSYIINARQITFLSNIYVASPTKGAGISDNKAMAIKNILRQMDQPNLYCTQRILRRISQRLTDLDGNKWNVVCKTNSALSGITGRIRNSNFQYFQGQQNLNSYLVWVI